MKTPRRLSPRSLFATLFAFLTLVSSPAGAIDNEPGPGVATSGDSATPSVTAPTGTIWFVNDNAPGANTGLNWNDAFLSLDSALAAAADNDEIWVAEGTYYPGAVSGFDLAKELAIYGGFAGGETLRSQRDPDPATNNTILSGDTDTDGDPGWPVPDPGNADHVMIIQSGLSQCVLDGFEISGGNANAGGDGDFGGGLLIYDSAPTLENLLFTRNSSSAGGAVMVRSGGTAVPFFRSATFHDNRSSASGGAVFHWSRDADYVDCVFSDNSANNAGGAAVNNGSAASFTDCTFDGNSSGSQGGAVYSTNSTGSMSGCLFNGNSATAGGALYNTSSPLTIDDCEFVLNSATTSSGGGAINNDSSDTPVSQCLFDRNSAVAAGGDGGAIRNASSNVTVTGGRFFDNQAADAGGAVSSALGTSLIVNSIFSGNSGDLGGALWSSGSATAVHCSFSANSAGQEGGAIYSSSGIIVLQNAILWANAATISGNQAGGSALDPASANNLVQDGLIDGIPGTILESDPLFVDPDGADNIAGTPDDNLRLQGISPAIAVGDEALIPAGVTTDLDGNPRVVPLAVELGAYERQNLGFPVADLEIVVPGGEEFVFPGWVPDMTAYNGGAGFDFHFALTGSTGTIAFAANPTIDPDGTLRFTPVESTTGTATFDVFVSDPGGTFPNSATLSFTITTGTLWFVNDDAPGADTGTSWNDAFLSFDSALAAAGDNDEIWVAEGIYYPGDASGFDITEETAIYGGFATGETRRSQRDSDPATNNTVLSGDLDMDGDPAWPSADADNADHVIIVQSGVVRGVLDGFEISGGNADASSSGDGVSGGGVLIRDSSPTFENVLFRRNAAWSGGAVGIDFWGSRIPLFRNVTFLENRAQNGGAVYQHRRPAEYIDCSFIDNRAYSGRGGAYFLISQIVIANPTARFTDCTFEGNTANHSGGAIGHFASATGSTTLTGCTLRDNSAPAGGAIQGGNLTITDCVFDLNAATNGNGGAIVTDIPALITRCVFTGNNALASGRDGGAISLTNSSGITISACKFYANECDGSGGAIIIGGSDPVIVNSLFSLNWSNQTGGGIHFRNSNPTIVNCTFFTNFSGQGGAIYKAANNGPALKNSVLWNNFATTSGSQVGGVPLDAASSNNLVQNGIAGGVPGTISEADPLFFDADGPDNVIGTLDDNLRLRLNSPALDVGDNAANMEPFDLDGAPRIHNGTIDLGAYEAAFVTFSELYPALDPHGDANGNGFSNYHDYAAGADPLALHDFSATPDFFENGGDYFLRFTHRSNAADAFACLEKSTNLTLWHDMIPGGDYLTISMTPLAPDRVEIVLWIFFDLSVDPHFFWRIVFSEAKP